MKRMIMGFNGNVLGIRRVKMTRGTAKAALRKANAGYFRSKGTRMEGMTKPAFGSQFETVRALYDHLQAALKGEL